MEVIILAGGMGTRLREVVADVPKPMAPIKGKPFLDYLLNWVLEYEVTKLVFAVGYKAEIIKGHFGNVFHGIPVFYSEETEPLGTGGAIVKALNFIEGENAMIINGDTYFPINLDWFNMFHQTSGRALSIALKEMKDFDRYGTVLLAGDTVTGFKEKMPLETGLINGGIYSLNKAFIQSMILPAVFSFEQAILEQQSLTGNLKAVAFTNVFIDIGIPTDYKKACEEL
ncbi:nucleotidyltransferase family protein [Mucilaginibacter glaciei]|uniref:Nucleotidyltransferase family protein n=1 Tax=Mucilaginibacter glaciei TaxID=2772109 RepID=A0A926NZP4_9SPHI|nr:nucleotidyltransferase family protein [Mucilaginibacter glaciei]MBD1394639.1 nucleotidyltransferase family protein [Mucilaginibacter glaciei]